jgi:hypothetical protein
MYRLGRLGAATVSSEVSFEISGLTPTASETVAHRGFIPIGGFRHRFGGRLSVHS